jgi:hypothetical protein
MNARSDAVLAWRGVGGRLQIVFASAGHFGPPHVMGAQTDDRPSVAINDAGDAAIAWIERGGAANPLRVLVRAHGHALGPVETVARGRRVGEPELTVARDGRVAIAWLATWGARRLRTAEREPRNGTWTPPNSLPDSQLLYYQPADEDLAGLGFRDDELMVGWTERHTPADSAVEQSVFRVATQPLGAAWNAPVTLARGGLQPEYTASLAFGPDGTAAAGWYQPRMAHERGALVASFAAPGQPFSNPTRIAPHPECSRSSCSTLLDLSLGLDATGGVRAAWDYYSGDIERIDAARAHLAR